LAFEILRKPVIGLATDDAPDYGIKFALTI